MNWDAILTYLANRLSEKSTYIGLGMLVTGLGVKFPGVVTWDNIMTFGMATGGLLGALLPARVQAKNVTPPVDVQRVVAVLLAIGLGAVAYGATDRAEAADMPLAVKAPAVVVDPCSLTSCSGWYVGAALIGAGSNLDILGSGINGSVFAGGGMIGVNAGYQLWNGRFFAAAEVLGAYDAASNVANGGNQRYFFAEVVKFGMGLQNLFSNGVGVTPSQGPVAIPNILASSLLSPYVQFGVAERPWGTGWISGAGADFTLGAGYNLDLSYMFIKYNTPALNAITLDRNENLLKLSLNRKF